MPSAAARFGLSFDLETIVGPLLDIDKVEIVREAMKSSDFTVMLETSFDEELNLRNITSLYLD